MAEVGLVGFAKVALDVARSVLPNYRSKFSKHVFTQPQLLAIVCLMRYEGWTLRKAEVRLAEHGELREALELDKAPDYTTLHRFLNRLDEWVLVRALGETVRRGPSPSSHARHDYQQESRSIGLQWMRLGCLSGCGQHLLRTAHTKPRW
ncbi:MAG TPA: transposase [Gammaproteobacteria bacterium]|nr:transposase [Gammaproteobacteria bacterium]